MPNPLLVLFSRLSGTHEEHLFHSYRDRDAHARSMCILLSVGIAWQHSPSHACIDRTSVPSACDRPSEQSPCAARNKHALYTGTDCCGEDHAQWKVGAAFNGRLTGGSAGPKSEPAH